MLRTWWPSRKLICSFIDTEDSRGLSIVAPAAGSSVSSFSFTAGLSFRVVPSDCLASIARYHHLFKVMSFMLRSALVRLCLFGHEYGRPLSGTSSLLHTAYEKGILQLLPHPSSNEASRYDPGSSCPVYICSVLFGSKKTANGPEKNQRSQDSPSRHELQKPQARPTLDLHAMNEPLVTATRPFGMTPPYVSDLGPYILRGSCVAFLDMCLPQADPGVVDPQ